jgi:hypothetical protein
MRVGLLLRLLLLWRVENKSQLLAFWTWLELEFDNKQIVKCVTNTWVSWIISDEIILQLCHHSNSSTSCCRMLKELMLTEYSQCNICNMNRLSIHRNLCMNIYVIFRGDIDKLRYQSQMGWDGHYISSCQISSHIYNGHPPLLQTHQT